MRLIKEILAPNQAELTGYLPDPSREMPNIDRRPAVLIFPGGGYAMCDEKPSALILGYSMTFGLIAVDRETQKRYPKPSLAALGKYAKEITL